MKEGYLEEILCLMEIESFQGRGLEALSWRWDGAGSIWEEGIGEWLWFLGWVSGVGLWRHPNLHVVEERYGKWGWACVGGGIPDPRGRGICCLCICNSPPLVPDQYGWSGLSQDQGQLLLSCCSPPFAGLPPFLSPQSQFYLRCLSGTPAFSVRSDEQIWVLQLLFMSLSLLRGDRTGYSHIHLFFPNLSANSFSSFLFSCSVSSHASLSCAIPCGHSVPRAPTPFSPYSWFLT